MEYADYLWKNSFTKPGAIEDVIDLELRNSGILTKLCAMDLEARLGNNFKGHYPYVGLDADLPYKLEGEWLIIEPYAET